MKLDLLKEEAIKKASSLNSEVVLLVIDRLLKQSDLKIQKCQCGFCNYCLVLKQYVDLKLKLHRLKKEFYSDYKIEYDFIMIKEKMMCLNFTKKGLSNLEEPEITFYVKDLDMGFFKVIFIKNIDNDLKKEFLDKAKHVKKVYYDYFIELLNIIKFINSNEEFKKIINIIEIMIGDYKFEFEKRNLLIEIEKLKRSKNFIKTLSSNSLDVIDKLF